jgi:hypothetical protein
LHVGDVLNRSVGCKGEYAQCCDVSQRIAISVKHGRPRVDRKLVPGIIDPRNGA